MIERKKFKSLKDIEGELSDVTLRTTEQNIFLESVKVLFDSIKKETKVHKPASLKQNRQRQLAWALRICMGFRGSCHFIPNDLLLKNSLLSILDGIIKELRYELENIK